MVSSVLGDADMITIKENSVLGYESYSAIVSKFVVSPKMIGFFVCIVRRNIDHICHRNFHGLLGECL